MKRRDIKDKIQTILNKKLNGSTIINWSGNDLDITIFCSGVETRIVYKPNRRIKVQKTIVEISDEIIRIYRNEILNMFLMY